MRNTLFISPATIKDTYTIVKNLDENLITPYILIAQERSILPILGECLYEELQAEIENCSLTASNKTLIEDYISSALMFETFDLMVEPSVAKLKNSGVIMNMGEHIQTVSHTDSVSLKKHYHELSEFYKERLIKYLECNKEIYPVCGCNIKSNHLNIGII